MKKPESFRELYNLVSPQDLLDVVDFSGINDHKNEQLRKIRRKLQKDLYNSINYSIFSDEIFNNRKEPRNLGREMNDVDYEIIVESIQDFYYWSRQFNHNFAHIFQRVMNALEISMEQITPIMDARIRDCTKCEKYGQCDHQGSYIRNNKWCFN